MIDWGKYPFVRLLIPWALGIWCFLSFLSFRPSPLVLITATLVLFFVSFLASRLARKSSANWVFAVVLYCYLVCAGYSLARFHDSEIKKTYFRSYSDDAVGYVARVYDCPVERANSIKVILDLEECYSDSSLIHPVSGRIVAYFPKTDLSATLKYGDMIAFLASIGEVAAPKNPQEFDYKSYLSRKGITGQVYLKDSDWLSVEVNRSNPLYAFSYRFRDILLRSLRRCGLQGDEYGVAAAILLGYDESLPAEVRQGYVAAGSMHILCVSGMHVGVIYLLASFLLSFLGGKKSRKVVKQLLLLALIWFYALLAGLSPSILRASLMISLVIVGELMQRKGFAVNSIAASAFVLLCINPYNLLEIGFLLSYAAVVGIVLLQRPIYGWLCFENKVLDKAWEITAVALAAQFATMPFTLFYFHQFTMYFWLSNLFMTPISFVVIMGGMVLLLVSWIPYLNVAVGYLVWGAVYIMNVLVSWIEALPYSIIKGLYIDGFQFAMLLAALLFVILLVVTKNRRFFLAMMASALLFVSSVAVGRYRVRNQQEVVFYSMRKHTAVDFVNGDRHVMLCDSALMSDEGVVDYSLRGNWTKCGLSLHPEMVAIENDFENDFVHKKDNLISAGGLLIALWPDEVPSVDSVDYRVPVDYLLVSGKQSPDVRLVTGHYDVKCLLIDATVPEYLAEKWKNQAEECGLAYKYLGDGALVCSVR